ncbi:MAG: tetratricopeptide repeat protein [Planctomycetota bacterium]
MTRRSWANRFAYPLLGACLVFSGCSLFEKADSFDEISMDQNTIDPQQIPKGAEIVKPKPGKPTPKALADFGKVQASLGRFESSEALYQRSLKLDKKFVPAYVGLAQVYMAQGQPEKALGILATAEKKVKRRDPMILNEFAVIKAKLGEYDVAIETLREAVQEEPDNEIYTMNLAGMQAVVGNYDEAYRLFATRLGPAEARYRLAGILFDQGKVDSCRQQLEFALKVNPQHEKSAAMLSHLTNGQEPIKAAGYSVQPK